PSSDPSRGVSMGTIMSRGLPQSLPAPLPFPLPSTTQPSRSRIHDSDLPLSPAPEARPPSHSFPNHRWPTRPEPSIRFDFSFRDHLKKGEDSARGRRRSEKEKV